MRQTYFSLILATVGRTTELDRLFYSLAAQSLLDFEVIVVDQNPDDRLRPVLARATNLGLAIRHHRHTPANLAAARNAGIAQAQGEWLGFPDDDCWYDSRLLERVYAASQHNSQCAEQVDGVIARWEEQGPTSDYPVWLDWHRSRRFRDIPVSSISLFLRRDLLQKIGDFDPRLGVGQWFAAAEETDLVLRALQSGAAFLHQPDARVHHALAPVAVREDAATRLAVRQRARGTGALYAKHDIPLWIIARGLLAPLCKPLITSAFKGNSAAALKHGYAEAAGRLDGLLAWRQIS